MAEDACMGRGNWSTFSLTALQQIRAFPASKLRRGSDVEPDRAAST